MTTSTIKGYELQATNTNSGQWGNVLNSQVIQYIDQNMGGVTNVTLGGIANVYIDPPDNRNAIIRLTGTLLTNVTVYISNVTGTGQYGGGFYFVENLTSGNFTVSIRNTNVATAAIISQNTQATIISDAVNGVRIVSVYSGYPYDGFATGTTMTFLQSSAPAGWTKSTAHDNKALRIVSSSGGGSGGSTAFTSVFAARTITSSQLPDHNITITDPGHIHSYVDRGNTKTNPGSGFGTFNVANDTSATYSTDSNITNVTAAFGTTARGGAQTTMDFSVQYVDAIICTKN